MLANNSKSSWVVVANGTTAKIFKRSYKKPHLQLIQEINAEEPHLKTTELGRDKPGRAFNAASDQTRYAMEPTDLHDKEKFNFARNIALILNKGAEEQQCDELIIITSPEFLGKLHKVLSKKSYDILAKEINKDLTHMNENEVWDYLYKAS